MTADASELYALQLEAWVRGIPSELHFWENWVATRGAQWPDDFAARLDPDRLVSVLEPNMAERLAAIGPAARVLDVGAGPLTVLGKRVEHGRVMIEACDPLALAYRRILDRHAVVPVLPTVPAQAETLSIAYAESSFDVVHCRNALDHSFDPVAGIFEMLRVVKPGGEVLLRHAIDEAVNASYNGLHQWNFRCEDDTFVVWNPRFRFDVTTMLAGYATVHVTQSANYVSAHMTRIGDVPPTPRLLPLPLQQAAWIDLACRLLGEGEAAARTQADVLRERQAAAAIASDRDAARADAAALRASTSWRLTAPLRRIATLLRGG